MTNLHLAMELQQAFVLSATLHVRKNGRGIPRRACRGTDEQGQIR
jgi:hypothetical protein